MAAISGPSSSGRFMAPLTVAITPDVSVPLSSAAARFARIKASLNTGLAAGDAIIRSERELADMIGDLQALRMQLRGAIARAGAERRQQDKLNALADARSAAIREARS